LPESGRKNNIGIKTRQLVISALFLAMALALSTFESLLPALPTPIPMRYGLANVAVMAALLYLSAGSAAFVTAGKSLYVFLTRGLLAGLTSLTGSVLSLLAMLLLMKIFRKKLPLLVLSVTGALFHNLGQFLIFLLISEVQLSWTYIGGLLLILALVTGTMTSLILKAVQRPMEAWLKHSSHVLLAIFMIPLIFISSSCAPADKKPARQEALFTQYLDTVSRLLVYTDDEEQFEEWSNILEQRLKEIDHKFNIFADSGGESNSLKDLNEQAGIAPVALDEETMALLELGIEAEEQTRGRVNIMLGAVTSLWHEARQYSLSNPDDARIPEDDQLKEAATHCDINDLILDHAAATAYIRDTKASVDVGAIAKGYALDLLVKDLRQAGAENFLLDLGGNIYAAGVNNSKDSQWTVGVKNPNPNQENGIVEVLSVQNMTVTTSGSYERSYQYEGINYHHIIDPLTLYPGNIFSSVTVISPDGSLGDTLSTALFLTPPEEIDTFISSFEQVEALFITVNDEMISSNGLENYLTKP
jgi:thiamine biosynthesis lipoprotein